MKFLSKMEEMRESGQVLVIIAIAMVGLAGFTALVVDGGMVYADRRHDQSTADAASLAGAAAAAEEFYARDISTENFSCSSSDVIAAMNAGVSKTLTQASNGNLTLETNLDNQNGVEVICEDSSDTYLEYHVMVTTEVETNFAQLVFGDDLKNTAEAVVKLTPGTPASEGGSVPVGGAGMIIMDKEECNAFEASGSYLIDSLGGVFINSNGGNGSCYAARLTGSGYLSGGDVGIASVGEVRTTGSTEFKEPLITGVAQIDDPLSMVVPPTDACSGPATEFSQSGSGSHTIDPGHYSRIRMTGSHQLTMNPGVYCIEATHQNRGFEITGSGQITGNGVTIYIKYGDFDLSGSGTRNLSAPTAGTCVGEACNYVGMLMYIDRDNDDGDVEITGSSVGHHIGTFYALNNDCKFSGSAMENYSMQFICGTIRTSGSHVIKVEFDEGQVFNIPGGGSGTPSKVELEK